jgi:hypothetical protein
MDETIQLMNATITRAASFTVALFLALSLVSCGSDAPSGPVITTIVVGQSGVVLDGLGSTQQLSAVVDDQHGSPIPSAAISWSTTAPAVAAVSSAGLVTAVAKGTATITATAGSVSASVSITVNQTPAAIATVSGDAQTGTVATALASPLIVQVNDLRGNGVPGIQVSFAVTQGQGSLGSSSVATDAAGRASTTWSLGPVTGAQSVTATVGTRSVNISAVAIAGPPAQITAISGNNQSGTVGTKLATPVVVKVTDSRGNPVPNATVMFSVAAGMGTAAPSSQQTGADGTASASWTLGNSPGAETLTASTAGPTTLSASFSATATASGTATQVNLTSVSQDTLVEGATISLVGTGFSTVTANDTVKIDGVVAAVIGATPTQLTTVVPAYDCRPARDGIVTVTIGTSTSAGITKRIHPASFVDMAAGTQQILQTPSGFCLQFRPSATGGDRYVFGVSAAAELPSTQFGVTVSSGVGAGSAVASGATGPRTLSVFSRPGGASRAPQSSVDREVAQRSAGQYAAEARLRQWERDHLPALARGVAANSAGAVLPRRSTVSAIPKIGDTLRVSVIDAGATNLCSAPTTTVLAKVKAIGSAGIWATDINNPGPDSLTDAEVRAYSDTFDLKIYASDVANFGAPSDIDGNGRVVIIMTIAVNKESGGNLAGFVFSGDLFSAASCASSNVGEYFYGNVPDPGNVAGTGARSHAAIAYQLPSLIAHEFSHDIQDARRLVLARGTGMSSWEAEGQAMMAQELVGHDVLGNSAGNDYTYAFLTSGQNPRWYKQGFDLLGAYFGFKYSSSGKNDNAPDDCSLYATTTTANIACFNGAFYGASWSFQRYLVDRFGATYPGGPTQLTRDVIGKNVGLSGRANWQALLGLSAAGFDSLYAQWSGMLVADDVISGESSALTMSSWNLSDILAGFGSSYQIYGQVHTFGSFTDSRTVNGGGTAYTAVSSVGAHPAMAIKVRDGSGAFLGSAMHAQLWIIRTR